MLKKLKASVVGLALLLASCSGCAGSPAAAKALQASSDALRNSAVVMGNLLQAERAVYEALCDSDAGPAPKQCPAIKAQFNAADKAYTDVNDQL